MVYYNEYTSAQYLSNVIFKQNELNEATNIVEKKL